MTASLIIACTIGWTAALVAIAVLIRVRRQSVRWETNGGVITFDRKLTEDEMEQFRTKWLRCYGARKTDEEQACGCWNGVRCVNHCTCHHCTALRRPAVTREEQPGA